MAHFDSTVEDNVQDLLSQEVEKLTIVAIMGTTGSGKSTFIQRATGDEEAVIGHGYQACTQRPWLHPRDGLSFEGKTVALLDTPGFDDTYKTDAEVLQDVATFLAGSYKNNIKLSGIIYLQRITDPRMTHAGLANLGLFRALCGDAPLRKVVLATTFWGEMKNLERAHEHEDELRTNPDYWGDMLSKDATMTRFYDTKESALEILHSLLQDEEKVTLKIQQEMVDEDRNLIETSAGETLQRELSALTERYEKKLQQYREETDAALKTRDVDVQEEKEKQAKKAEDMRRIFQHQMDVLLSRNREDLRARDMEFDRLRIQLKEQEIETTQSDQAPSSEGIEEEPPDVHEAEDAKAEGQEIDRSIEEREKKLERRQKILKIFGALGTTAAAAGLSVINPLAIPVAFSGLIDLINACFSRLEPDELNRKPEVYNSF